MKQYTYHKSESITATSTKYIYINTQTEVENLLHKYNKNTIMQPSSSDQWGVEVDNRRNQHGKLELP